MQASRKAAPVVRRVCAVVVLAAAIGTAGAGVKQPDECFEGADFIANAARSRDNGMAREDYLARVEHDLLAIRAFPVSLRWFARDEDDERLLLVAAARVFDAPRSAAQHHAEFLAACLERVPG